MIMFEPSSTAQTLSFGVDAHTVGERQAVRVRDPLLHELEVLVELEQSGRISAAGAAAPAGAREDEQVMRGVHRHALGLSQGLARDAQGKDLLFDLNLRRRRRRRGRRPDRGPGRRLQSVS